MMQVSTLTYGGVQFPVIVFNAQFGIEQGVINRALNIIDSDNATSELQFTNTELNNIFKFDYNHSTGNLTLDSSGDKDLIINENTFILGETNLTGKLRFSDSSAFGADLEYDGPTLGDILYFNTTSGNWQKSFGTATNDRSLTYCTKGGVQWVAVIGGGLCPL